MHRAHGYRVKSWFGGPVVFKALTILAASAFYVATPLSSHAGQPEAKMSVLPPPPLEVTPPSLIHGLINLEFSDHYITPRGLDVQNKGLVIQPLVLLFFDVYSSKTNVINDVSLMIGDWNSVHTAIAGSGPKPGHWNETDPTTGLSITFLKDWQFEAAYTAFVSEVDAFSTSQNVDLKLRYHDKFLGGFSINPYAEFFLETSNKATVVFDKATSKRGYYFQLGIDPAYAFKTIPLTLDFPTYVNFPDQNFYQAANGSGSSSTIGLFTTEFRATVPLKFIPKGYGNWNVYAGVQYYYLNNKGLLDENQVLATTERHRNLVQFHGGLTLTF
jgi:hypothetical protein